MVCTKNPKLGEQITRNALITRGRGGTLFSRRGRPPPSNGREMGVVCRTTDLFYSSAKNKDIARACACEGEEK